MTANGNESLILGNHPFSHPQNSDISTPQGYIHLPGELSAQEDKGTHSHRLPGRIKVGVRFRKPDDFPLPSVASPLSAGSLPNLTLKRNPVLPRILSSSRHLSHVTVTSPLTSQSTPMKWPDFSAETSTSRSAAQISEFSKCSKNSFPTLQRKSFRPWVNPFIGTIKSSFIGPIDRLRVAKV